MRTRTGNVLLLLAGLGFSGLGIDSYVDLIRTIITNYRYAGLNSVDGYALIFGSIYLVVGLWCLLGAIGNLRKLQSIQRKSVRTSESLVRWHLRILAAAVACELVAAVAYWRWQAIPSGGLKSVHWIMVATFAVIPLTVIAAMVLRKREE